VSSGTHSWFDAVYLSRDPTFIAERALLLGSFPHAHVEGLAGGGSYTASASVRLPAGADGGYTLHVVTDAGSEPAGLGSQAALAELTAGGDNRSARDLYYAASVYEGERNDNNLGSAPLQIVYREADLQVDALTLSATDARSGQPLTATWTVSNRGGRETRSSSWLDGLYLSRDSSLDEGDYPLLDPGSPTEPSLAAHTISLVEHGAPKYLQPGEAYTASATFTLPESLSGDFRVILRTDTALGSNPWERSAIRDGLPGLISLGDGSGLVQEFRAEGNNEASTTLTLTPGTPADLQVAEVEAPASVLAGQPLTIAWRAVNVGGDTPADQTRWNDLVYLSRDRFLDLEQDRYLGYVEHVGRLTGGSDYAARLEASTPADLAGAYYVFVVSDPARAWGSGERGQVREFGNEQNNATSAPQPILVATPPPADLKLNRFACRRTPRSAKRSAIDFTIVNDSPNAA
jgi:hypothetical protein